MDTTTLMRACGECGAMTVNMPGDCLVCVSLDFEAAWERLEGTVDRRARQIAASVRELEAAAAAVQLPGEPARFGSLEAARASDAARMRGTVAQLLAEASALAAEFAEDYAAYAVAAAELEIAAARVAALGGDR